MKRISFKEALRQMHEREAEEFGLSVPATENGSPTRRFPKRNHCPCEKAMVMRDAPLHCIRCGKSVKHGD